VYVVRRLIHEGKVVVASEQVPALSLGFTAAQTRTAFAILQVAKGYAQRNNN
jgi:hypothetical protein